MKIISWNCQGAFRKKADRILPLFPDIAVVQECEHPDNLLFGSTTKQPNDCIWFGDNKHKGLGIFSYGNYKLRLIKKHNADIKIILPIAVTDGQTDFTLFAIWANNPGDPEGQYVEQIWKAMKHYDRLLNTERVILTGDFNSNKIWDKPRRVGNHSDVVTRLAEKNIFSIYHKCLKQEQGKESHPTFFLYRNKNKPYHLDYCFASLYFLNKVSTIEVGTYKDWIQYSDHTPIVTTFNLTRSQHH